MGVGMRTQIDFVMVSRHLLDQLHSYHILLALSPILDVHTLCISHCFVYNNSVDQLFLVRMKVPTDFI